MIFHENHLLADDSHEISYLIFFQKFGKMLKNLSSAAVVIGAKGVNVRLIRRHYFRPTGETKIRLKEQSDQGLHCLPF